MTRVRGVPLGHLSDDDRLSPIPRVGFVRLKVYKINTFDQMCAYCNGADMQMTSQR
jgi:hypothetical protein